MWCMLHKSATADLFNYFLFFFVSFRVFCKWPGDFLLFAFLYSSYTILFCYPSLRLAPPLVHVFVFSLSLDFAFSIVFHFFPLTYFSPLSSLFLYFWNCLVKNIILFTPLVFFFLVCYLNIKACVPRTDGGGDGRATQRHGYVSGDL